MTASAAIEGGQESRVERAFPALDGLRAIAATAVLVHHVAFWTGDYTPDQLGRVFARLDVGVPIFFVLSGFLLSRPFLLAVVQGRRAPRTAAYLWRRGLRILPAYWLTVVAALLVLPQNDGAGLQTWTRHLTLTQIYGAGHLAEGLSHTWSLATEVSFYLALPLIVLGLARLVGPHPHRPARVLAALGGAALLGSAVLAVHWGTGATVPLALDLWLPTFAGWFGAGMALALLTVADPGWRPVRIATELGASLGTCWAAAGALFWVATTPLAGPLGLVEPTPGQAVFKQTLYLGVATLLVLPLVLGDQRAGLARQALGSRAGRFLGEISYGVFLVHVTVLAGAFALFDLVQFTGNVVVVGTGTWLVSVALATLLYRLVERPASRWRTLVQDPVAPAVTSSAATTATTASSAST
ncbi:acyltransferase family protein [Blastococcus sp. SYSU DS1024]